MIRQIRPDIVDFPPEDHPPVVRFVVFSDFFQGDVASQRGAFSLGEVRGTAQEGQPVVEAEAGADFAFGGAAAAGIFWKGRVVHSFRLSCSRSNGCR